MKEARPFIVAKEKAFRNIEATHAQTWWWAATTTALSYDNLKDRPQGKAWSAVTKERRRLSREDTGTHTHGKGTVFAAKAVEAQGESTYSRQRQ